MIYFTNFKIPNFSGGGSQIEDGIGSFFIISFILISIGFFENDFGILKDSSNASSNYYLVNKLNRTLRRLFY